MRRLTLLTNPDLCNLHCPLCFLNQRGQGGGVGEMPFEIAKAAIERYAAERDERGNRLLREVIPSTMGEPLLYSKFDELLQICQVNSLKLNLTTNGTFPGKWRDEFGMRKLLAACSDIKVSSLSFEMGGISNSQWRENVKRLLDCRDRMKVDGNACLATVSLQVTLHGENAPDESTALKWAKDILLFAENNDIHRIKWNPVVILDGASAELRSRYSVNKDVLDKLRLELQTGELRSSKVKNEGSLFFDRPVGLCPVGGKCVACPFEDEVWVWPDGHEDHCPNPERRWKI